MSLERLDLEDFTPGLNLRAGQFQLGAGESPAMLNVEVDPVSGFMSRPGLIRWNAADDVVTSTWNPRSVERAQLSTGSYQIYATMGSTIYSAGANGVFSDLSIPCNATPHLADFAFWGDITYIATGTNAAVVSSSGWKREGTGTPVQLTDASLGYNDNYTVPLYNHMPIASHVETHASYLFCADITELGTYAGSHPNRIRWSHPNEPEDWATADFIDIDNGGGRITAIQSFRDHLLIFKTESVWALYGYDLASWQLVEVSRALGAPTKTAIGRSESSVFFFSGTSGSGVYVYDGSTATKISSNLDPAMSAIGNQDNIWLGWVGNRLWVSTEWLPAESVGTRTGAFVWDPSMGGKFGSWVFHVPAVGSFRSIVERSDTNGAYPLIALYAPGEASCLVSVPSRYGDIASSKDQVLESPAASTAFACSYTTGWLTMGWPDRLKSWLRPRFVSRRNVSGSAVTLRMDVFKDYDESNAARSASASILPTSNSITWRALGYSDPLPNGFDFKEDGSAEADGKGADFSSGQVGSVIRRAVTGFGTARAIRITISNGQDILTDTDAGEPWAIDAIFLKIRYRKFTT